MSQHWYECTTADGDKYTLQMGWDKPLQEYYCNISKGDSDDPFYMSLHEYPEHRTLDTFLLVCNSYGITPPGGMLQEVAVDRSQNVVNKVKSWN